MSRRKNKQKLQAFASALAYIAVGVLLCIFKGSALGWTMTAFGILFIAQGILDLVLDKDIYSAVINCAIGVLILIFGWLIATVVLYVLGALLIAYGAYNILRGPKLLLFIATNVITALVGVLLIVAQAATIDWFYVIVGIVLIINGILTLFGKR